MRLVVEKLEEIDTAIGSPSGMITIRRVTAIIIKFITL
jgi:hypothetical protein